MTTVQENGEVNPQGISPHVQQLELLLGVVSRKHHYRHEALFKDEVISDLGKIEDIMAQKDKPYWELHELREAIGAKKDDFSRQLYVSNLVSYLQDERVITTGGPNSPNQYTLVHANHCDGPSSV